MEDQDYAEFEKPIQRKRGFRVNAKLIFLTFPQIAPGVTKEIVLERLKTFFHLRARTIENIIVCMEDHKNQQGKHIHVSLVLDKAYDIKNPKIFDEIVGKHGDIRSTRSWPRSVKYVSKDGDYIAEGFSVEAVLNSLKSKKGIAYETVAEEILNGATMKTLLHTHKGFMLQNTRKVKEFMNEVSITLAEEEQKMPFHGVSWPKIIRFEHAYNQVIGEWINLNFGGKKREVKQKQLWISGPTGIGKTWLIRQLDKYFRMYMSPNESFDSSYRNGAYDFAVFEEFHGQKTITYMNQFLEGYKMQLNVKGGFSILKTDNLPCIILSNRSIREIYHNSSDVLIEALEARLTVVEIGQGGQINLKFNDPPKEMLPPKKDLNRRTFHLSQSMLEESQPLLKKRKAVINLVEDDEELSSTELAEETKKTREEPIDFGFFQRRDKKSLQDFLKASEEDIEIIENNSEDDSFDENIDELFK